MEGNFKIVKKCLLYLESLVSFRLESGRTMHSPDICEEVSMDLENMENVTKRLEICVKDHIYLYERRAEFS